MPTLVSELTPEYRFSPPPKFPHYCTSAINRVHDLLWELRLGIRTNGSAPSPHPDARPYRAFAYDTYLKILRRLVLDRSDVVVDVGCGKGRVVCLAARFPVRAAIGVEIDPGLCHAARANGEKMRGRRASVHFVCQSATEFDFASATAIILISPFGEKTMESTLARIEQSIEARPRPLKLVYGNPVLSSMLAAKPWLKLYECWRPAAWSRVKFPVHFYRSTIALAAGAIKRLQETSFEVLEMAQHYPL